MLNADKTFTYTPTGNYNGTDSFAYRVSDGQAQSNIVTVSLTVMAVNDAPVAVADSASTSEDTAVDIAVLANDSDVESGTLTPTVVTGPAHGTVTLNPNGTFHYTPTANYNGTDSFTYRVSDGQAQSNVVTVSLTVTAVNDLPVATNDSVQVTINSSARIDVLANDTDIDSTTLTPSVVAGPSHGTVTLNSDGSFQYAPTSGYSGTDSFTYRLNDGQSNSNVATVSIQVLANTAPVAVDRALTLQEDDIHVLTWAELGIIDSDSTNLSVIFEHPNRGELQFYNGTEWVAVTDLHPVLTRRDRCEATSAMSPGRMRRVSRAIRTMAPTATVGDRYARFYFGGFDGIAYSEAAQMVITVMPVADAPIITAYDAGDGYSTVVASMNLDTVPNPDDAPTILPGPTLDGWTLITNPPGGEAALGGVDAFKIWQNGDTFVYPNGDEVSVVRLQQQLANELADKAGATSRHWVSSARSRRLLAGSTGEFYYVGGPAGFPGNSAADMKVYADDVVIGEIDGASGDSSEWHQYSFLVLGHWRAGDDQSREHAGGTAGISRRHDR